MTRKEKRATAEEGKEKKNNGSREKKESRGRGTLKPCLLKKGKSPWKVLLKTEYSLSPLKGKVTA